MTGGAVTTAGAGEEPGDQWAGGAGPIQPRRSQCAAGLRCNAAIPRSAHGADCAHWI